MLVMLLSRWQIMASHLPDGAYDIVAEFSINGSSSVQVTTLTQIVIDTVGPTVTAATYNRRTGQVTLTFSDPMGLRPGGPRQFRVLRGAQRVSPCLGCRLPFLPCPVLGTMR